MWRCYVLALIVSCRGGFDAIDARVTDADPPQRDAMPIRPDAAITVVEARVNCASGTRTGKELCMAAGFAGATIVRGYHWFQCAGPGACPTGWADDGITCPDWCAGADCSSWAYCGEGQVITERTGDEQVAFDPAELISCVGYNPGWLVRAHCTN